MASLAQDMIPGQAGQGGAARAPLSTHPAFPFIVGLWFAALLGIGSLVVPVPLIERLMEVTGLATIVPQTAPPLGFTARALIALVCTVGGGLAGLLIARKVAEAHRAPKTRKDRGQLAARRPIAAHDELGADGFDGPNPFGTPRGRRALAIAEEDTPSEVFELAPLPGRPLPLSALDLGEMEALELADAEMIDADPAGEYSQTDAGDPPMPGFTTLTDYDADEPARRDFSMAERRHFKLDTFGQTVGAPIQPRQQFVLDPAPVDIELVDEEPMDHAPADEADAPNPQPEADLHFSPPSLARPFAQPAMQPAAQPDFGPDFGPDFTEDAEMDQFAESASAVVSGPELADIEPVDNAPAAQWQDGELDDLALVQLAQRLGSSIARRRELRAAAAAAASVSPVAIQAAQPAAMPAVLAEEFDAAEAAQAMAAYFGAPAAAPVAEAPLAAALTAEAAVAPVPTITPPAPPSTMADVSTAGRQVFRPVAPEPVAAPPAAIANLAHIDLGEDEDDEDEHIAHLTASFSLPLARPVGEEAQAETPRLPQDALEQEDAAEETVAPARFANPFQQAAQPFVRIENEPQPEEGLVEPAVVFPGEAREDVSAATSRANAEENERALREALLGLQRMSGAA